MKWLVVVGLIMVAVWAQRRHETRAQERLGKPRTPPP
jgi:hypothetical protein